MPSINEWVSLLLVNRELVRRVLVSRMAIVSARNKTSPFEGDVKRLAPVLGPFTHLMQHGGRLAQRRDGLHADGHTKRAAPTPKDTPLLLAS